MGVLNGTSEVGIRECRMASLQLADLALFSSSLGGSNLCAGSGCVSLMVKMPDKVLCGSRLGRNEVLFFLTIEKIRSSSAFECGIISTNRPILDRRGKRSPLSGIFIDAM